MAAPTTGLTIIKRFAYRGDASEEWSNHYWLTGSTPADSSAWKVLFDALVAEEKKVYNANSSVVAGYGYNTVADDRTAVWTVDMTVSPNAPVAGSGSWTGSAFAGDQAAWVRWGLDRLNTKGKRIYLRKFFHSGAINAGATGDPLAPTYITSLAAFGLKMRDGTFAGARVVTDTRGTATVGHGTSSYVTTRTLKRRGKRPPT